MVGQTPISLDDLPVEPGSRILRAADVDAWREGYRFLALVREAGYSAAALPAIALTAFSRMEDRSQALRAGFQEHLVKPLDPQMLISRVSALSKPKRKA